MQFDYILLADVIEHLNNPGIALRSIKRLMKKNTLLIITTPNVFSYRNIKTFLSGKEVVHPDHTFWPSVKTMKKLFANNGFKIKSYFYCFWGSYKDKKTINRVFSRVLAKLFPHLLPCLCFILKGN
jgi:SAM-dependent methyltransferase